MALRDQLNVSTRSELYNFVMQSDQVLTVLGITVAGDIPAELWYFAAGSMATDNGTTVIKPTSIPGGNPGRYLRWIQESDWNYTTNKPTIPAAQVNSDWNAVSGVAQILNKPTNVSVFTNDAGYITGITSGQIAAALGYTPANQARNITINGTTQDLSADRTWNVGDVLTSGSYANPSWITSLAFSKITWPGTTAQYIRGDGTLATFPTNVSTFTNDAGYLTTINSGQVTTALGFTPVTNARTLTINGTAFDLTANRTWNVGTVTSVAASITSGAIAIGGSPITSSGTLAFTYTGTSAQYIRGDGAATTFPAFQPPVSSINSVAAGARNFNQAYQVSTTKYVDVRMSSSITCNLSLSGGQSGEVFLEYSADGSTGWTLAGKAAGSNTGTLTIGLATQQITGNQLSCMLSPGYYWRLRTNNVTGAPTYTFTGGTEISY